MLLLILCKAEQQIQLLMKICFNYTNSELSLLMWERLLSARDTIQYFWTFSQNIVVFSLPQL